MIKRIAVWSCIVMVCSILSVCICMGSVKKEEEAEPDRMLFSWYKSAITKESDKLFSTMKELKANKLYQYFPASLKDEEVVEFLTKAKEEGIEVFLLTGEREWAFDGNGKAQIAILEKIERLNALVPQDAGIKGVVYDVEPYLMEEWETEADQIMRTYLHAMKKTHDEAQKKGLCMVACIPYHFDTKGYEYELKELIKDGCDEVAVMNYYRKQEIALIKTEASYAKKYNKPITSIYEFKPVGVHGLVSENTYNRKGVKAAVENFEELRKKYSGQQVNMGYHDYEDIKEVMKRE